MVPDRSNSNSSGGGGRPRLGIPSGSWDSHMHVVDPVKYPLAVGAAYRPEPHSLDQALAFYRGLGGVEGMVLVQPSIYGNDNSCLLDALRQLGPGRGRGVVCLDPSPGAGLDEAELREWHRLGVRAVRVNFASVGATADAAALADLLARYAAVCRPLGWAIQLYVPLPMVEMLEPVVPRLGGVRLVIDHIGNPARSDLRASPADPYAMRGFRSLVGLLESGDAFVKLSGAYRITPEYSELEPVAKEILRVAGATRVVFATDWPHTRFEGLDIQPWVQTVLDWCGSDEVLVERIFRDNAIDLWDVKPEP